MPRKEDVMVRTFLEYAIDFLSMEEEHYSDFEEVYRVYLNEGGRLDRETLMNELFSGYFDEYQEEVMACYLDFFQEGLKKMLEDPRAAAAGYADLSVRFAQLLKYCGMQIRSEGGYVFLGFKDTDSYWYLDDVIREVLPVPYWNDSNYDMKAKLHDGWREVGPNGIYFVTRTVENGHVCDQRVDTDGRIYPIYREDWYEEEINSFGSEMIFLIVGATYAEVEDYTYRYTEDGFYDHVSDEDDKPLIDAIFDEDGYWDVEGTYRFWSGLSLVCFGGGTRLFGVDGWLEFPTIDTVKAEREMLDHLREQYGDPFYDYIWKDWVCDAKAKYGTDWDAVLTCEARCGLLDVEEEEE